MIRQELTDLKERLQKAEIELRNLSDVTPSESESVKLAARASGVSLALSYLLETINGEWGQGKEDWHEVGIDVDYWWHQFTHARDLLTQAGTLVELSNKMHDLRTWLPGYDYESGTLPWEREDADR